MGQCGKAMTKHCCCLGFGKCETGTKLRFKKHGRGMYGLYYWSTLWPTWCYINWGNSFFWGGQQPTICIKRMGFLSYFLSFELHPSNFQLLPKQLTLSHPVHHQAQWWIWACAGGWPFILGTSTKVWFPPRAPTVWKEWYASNSWFSWIIASDFTKAPFPKEAEKRTPCEDLGRHLTQHHHHITSSII